MELLFVEASGRAINKSPGLACRGIYNDALRRDSASRTMCLRRLQRVMRGFKMTDRRPFKATLAFQIVRLKIEQIFEECSKFEEKDRKALYEVMGTLLLQRIGPAETPIPADETAPGSTELTDAVATDDSTALSNKSGLSIVDVNAAFPK